MWSGKFFFIKKLIVPRWTTYFWLGTFFWSVWSILIFFRGSVIDTCGLVKLQQRIHKEIQCFIIVRRKKMWHIKNKKIRLFFTTKRKLLLRCGNNYWPAVAFTFCATFKKAIDRPKNDPRLFFSQIYSSMDKLLSFQELWKGVQGKRRKNHYQSAVLLYWYAKTIMKLL